MSSRLCFRRAALATQRVARLAPRSNQAVRQWALPRTGQHGARTLPATARRTYATAARSEADEKMELIQDQYATAKDEFEIAVEETEKKTVYAADDRAAATEECKKLKDLYEDTVKSSSPEVAAEVTRRVGQRIRELEEAIKGLEASAMED